MATPDDSDDVLGTVTVCPPHSPWREVAQPGEGEFRMLAVAPTARGSGRRRGAGQALHRAARAQGARALVLCSLEAMTDAHRLYHRLGFERIPERDWDPVPDVHLIAFRKRLDD